jgi:hypothetical protein
MPRYGFNVVHSAASISGLVLQHEIGHNLGAMHDRDNSDADSLYPYGYGHRFTGVDGKVYRTAMCYAPGRRVNHYSNPDVSVHGVPTGVASGGLAADNARGFETTAVAVADYAPHVHRGPTADAGVPRLWRDDDEDSFVEVHLDGSASTAEDQIVSWEWTWDGGSASGEKVSEVFPLGRTPVILTVTDDEGATDIDAISVNIAVGEDFYSWLAGYVDEELINPYGAYGIDADGDGLDNLEERKLGLSPIKPFHLEAEASMMLVDGRLQVLLEPYTPSVHCELFGSKDLESWTALPEAPQILEGGLCFEVPANEESFYRIEISTLE